MLNLITRYCSVALISTSLVTGYMVKTHYDLKKNYKESVWHSLAQDFKLDHHKNNPVVQKELKWFSQHQGFMLDATRRSTPFIYYVKEEIKKRGLPAELVLLPVIESSYNAAATSRVGAAGMWQLMPATAKGLALKQNKWYDGRRDAIASTQAALNYLSYLRNYFDGKWLLAIAAYNDGQGNIRKATKKQGSDDFWLLPLPLETQHYVPSLMAVAMIIGNPDTYHIKLPDIKNEPRISILDLSEQIDLRQVAALADIDLIDVKKLNSGYKHWITPPNGPHRIVLPKQHTEMFKENLQKTPTEELVNWVRYKIKAHDTLKAVSKKFEVPINLIRQANTLDHDQLKPGNILILPLNATKATTHKAKMTVSDAKEPGPNQIIHIARLNETLDSIAKKYHVNKRSLYYWNNFKRNQTIKEDDEVVIWKLTSS